MKKIYSLLFVLFVAVSVFAADKVKTVFTLDHQMSEHCEKKIKSNLRYEKGVSNIDVSLKENTITITYADDKTNDEKLLEAFKKIGFNAMIVNPEGCGSCQQHQQPAHSCCGHCNSSNNSQCSHHNNK